MRATAWAVAFRNFPAIKDVRFDSSLLHLHSCISSFPQITCFRRKEPVERPVGASVLHEFHGPSRSNLNQFPLVSIRLGQIWASTRPWSPRHWSLACRLAALDWEERAAAKAKAAAKACGVGAWWGGGTTGCVAFRWLGMAGWLSGTTKPSPFANQFGESAAVAPARRGP